MIKVLRVSEAVGAVLCHDVTRIVPGEFKGRAFRKGHVITEADVPLLLEIGKEHIYALELGPGKVHENEAAERIARAAAGPGLGLSEVCEGRVNLIAERQGLLKVDVEALDRLNTIPDVVFATMHTNHVTPGGRPVAGTRVIPLVVDEETVARAEAVCRRQAPLIQVKPLAAWPIGVVTTGSEVFRGLIKDEFGPVVSRKFSELGSTVMRQVYVSDDPVMTVQAIVGLIEEGARMVVVTGGMSVDPDDRTPASIRATGAEVVIYGAPTFPGAMFMLAYLGDVPIIGLPGCVMYYQATIFDLVVPRILAGERVTRTDVQSLGHGGFCAGCPDCRYPICGFGKG
ncbi:MAG: molybdopterin-binding protein [Proteobacteria bacterium]|nr:molybdopterin-binding protein [Pseudomonadota bacterium]